jgi:hypothetical protein
VLLGFSGRLQEGAAAEPQEAGEHSLALLPAAASAAGRCMAATGVVHAFAPTAGYADGVLTQRTNLTHAWAFHAGQRCLHLLSCTSVRTMGRCGLECPCNHANVSRIPLHAAAPASSWPTCCSTSGPTARGRCCCCLCRGRRRRHSSSSSGSRQRRRPKRSLIAAVQLRRQHRTPSRQLASSASGSAPGCLPGAREPASRVFALLLSVTPLPGTSFVLATAWPCQQQGSFTCMRL